MALIAALAIPLLAALLCWVQPLRRAAWGITLASAGISLRASGCRFRPK